MTPEQQRICERELKRSVPQRKVAQMAGVSATAVARIAEQIRSLPEATPEQRRLWRGRRRVRRITAQAERALLKCLEYLERLAASDNADPKAVMMGSKVAAEIVGAWEPAVADLEGENASAASTVPPYVSLLRRVEQLPAKSV
jgi:hypothetical protein